MFLIMANDDTRNTHQVYEFAAILGYVRAAGDDQLSSVARRCVDGALLRVDPEQGRAIFSSAYDAGSLAHSNDSARARKIQITGYRRILEVV